MQDPMHYLRPGLLQLSSLPPLSLYVHLPWCLKKCPYCDFNSHAWRSAGEGGEALPEQRYLDAVIADLEAALPLIWGRQVVSIFIGGGTPSLFAPASIERLLSDLRARLRLEPDCEITLEANPGTFEKDRFRALRAAGVTRLSIGVQSFDDRFLQALGRVHDGAQARAAVQEAAQVFDTFNLDLMYALPGQTLADLERDLATALDFAPPHLSVYHLTGSLVTTWALARARTANSALPTASCARCACAIPSATWRRPWLAKRWRKTKTCAAPICRLSTCSMHCACARGLRCRTSPSAPACL